MLVELGILPTLKRSELHKFSLALNKPNLIPT